MANIGLSRLRPGDKGTIESVSGNEVIKRRLLEMGLLPGSIIEVIRRAPLGDPIEVKIKGYNLSLRETEASNIQVEQLLERRSDDAIDNYS